ncbi:hypothetical protein [Nonomuraea sp. GTA35]|uniref:hypothetical protein n=1 Tax=Nonomuraea sp. GTA35 TaxID=1676746 RepID=UPI0035C142DC
MEQVRTDPAPLGIVPGVGGTCQALLCTTPSTGGASRTLLGTTPSTGGRAWQAFPSIAPGSPGTGPAGVGVAARVRTGRRHRRPGFAESCTTYSVTRASAPYRGAW